MSGDRPLNHETEFAIAEDLRAVPLHSLQAGEPLRFSVFGKDGVLLLAKGNIITPTVLFSLSQRGVNSVLVHREESATSVTIESRGTLAEVPPFRPGQKVHYHSEESRRLDGKIGAKTGATQRAEGIPLLQRVRSRGPVGYDAQLAKEIRASHESFVTSLREMTSDLLEHRPRAAKTSTDYVGRYLELLVDDLDLFTAYSVSPHLSHYPQRHGLHVAMLSMAIGVRAGLDRDRVTCLGLGALLHDIGMLRVPQVLWRQKVDLTPSQRADLMEHPIHSVNMLAGADIPDEVRIICYQVHERVSGIGYPRRLAKANIDPLARLAGLADSYVAMVSDRPHRSGIMPYRAMEAIIRQVRLGGIDSGDARLLLETLSLYPLGSFLRLSDQRLAKVIRANGSAYHRPVVRAWDQRTLPRDEEGEIVDLNQHPDLEVVESVPPPLVS